MEVVAHTACALVVLMAAAAPEVQAQTDGVSPVIDNERVTVREVTLIPGQPGSIERHNTDFVTIFLDGGKIHTVDRDGKSSVAVRRSGDVIFGVRGEETEEVISRGPSRLVVVELKDHPVPPLVNKSGYPNAFPRPGSKKVLDNGRVVAWDYTWKPGVATRMHYHDKDVVLVYKEDGSIKSTTPDGKSVVSDHTAGTVAFNKGDRTHFEELVKGRESAIIVELK
jgi:quercetin dioxygenase-like cupin family protein